MFFAAIVAVVLYATFGAVSDAWGRKTVYFIGAAAMAITIGPALWLVSTGNVWLFGLAVLLVFGFAMGPVGGATGSLFSLLFSPEVRYSGASVGYTISQIAGSAFAPLIATALFGAYGTLVPLFVYMIAVSLITLVSLLLVGGPWGRREAAAQDAAERAEARSGAEAAAV